MYKISKSISADGADKNFGPVLYMTVTLTWTWTRGLGMEGGKILDQYVSSYQRWIKSVIRLENNEVSKTLKKTLKFKF